MWNKPGFKIYELHQKKGSPLEESLNVKLKHPLINLKQPNERKRKLLQNNKEILLIL